jgi:hypothetical protein
MDKQCRFCLEEAETPTNPLIEPCNCNGTARFIHTICLNRWIATNPTENGYCCNVCLGEFDLPDSDFFEVIPRNRRLSVLFLENIHYIGCAIHTVALVLPYQRKHFYIGVIMQTGYLLAATSNMRINNVKIYWSVFIRSRALAVVLLYIYFTLRMNAMNPLLWCAYIYLLDSSFWKHHVNILRQINTILYEN